MNTPPSSPVSVPVLALGIDTGGTQTRWALANDAEEIIASGTAAGLSALQLSNHDGKQAFHQVLSCLADTARSHGILQTVRAGITGLGDDIHSQQLHDMLAKTLGLPKSSIRLSNDIEIAYLDSFKAGAGYLIYAGTGSIAAFIDEAGEFHRAGGRGYLLDDGGSGFWIAREAMRHIWRLEDEAPEQWRHSPLAQALFHLIGSSDWNASRDFIYHRGRGEIGTLALAVAAAAHTDPVALDILQRAGVELARLGMALCRRFGKRPMVLSGRVQELHPIIVESMRAHLADDISLRQSICQAHFSAARLAAQHLKAL
ncbi:MULTISPECIES: N-acetylglucosamine kinase [unclassified Undibacterium]|uniref:N-acetylglucosamine kinase n=1 Tax=unclassified Undibacterium TaxID=2630295 RepID=UPI002AC927AD|nr:MULTISPECIES: BadF/BadG/BcrA/BcrD ATPase family protein [unclassified Undibacterium]MEB0140267.1 BadF/BadG/BcrA/BcrD ATPase family protein [Undibacterium sp. CCC2.1]MEB0173319.1 BadF/BadG/BcrA/BcrD ATPase family protein [Undibacterium sp. CCC1.1]MEB0177138.1 BadF/BadG/BcrA/BcrD ATPase family protein [Undibacterium sp. CCC3.4]MEB0216406.1 BadF/BadG/BcrA/BcrD ATPase family protein [Undibacterium sp. 5I2]WPX45539.1 BadF/BadG/BcrA/BcrD ATPase family protein [Undibacterium sp. CCC3.4]